MLNIPVLSGAFLLCIHEFMPAGVISADNILISMINDHRKAVVFKNFHLLMAEILSVNIKAADLDRGFCMVMAVRRNERRALQALMLKGKGSQPFFPHQQKATRRISSSS
jgi:hypothetical protein